MLPVPVDLQEQYKKYLNGREVRSSMHGICLKWLRYYLDFCHNYQLPPKQQESLPTFIQKLQAKRQTAAQQE